VASVTVYVTDLKDLAAVQQVRREMLKPPYPASTLVKVAALVKPEYLIEISAVAVIPDSRAKRPG
jgi:enamine deaminase RidA (YjgF/YER057c/UK114 family)